MKITLRPLATDDWLGRKHVRGVYASQEVFQADLLNRALIELHEQRGHEPKRTKALLWYMWEDAQTNPLPHGDKLEFDRLAHDAFAECVSANHTVAALSLLRQVRMEQVMLAHLRHNFGRDLGEKAQAIVDGYHDQKLKVGMHVNGVPAEEGHWIYAMTGEELLEHTPDIYWYFNEFLNVPYMVDAKLLRPARLIVATSYSMKELERLRSDTMLPLHLFAVSTQFNHEIEDWRSQYLMRQTQMIFIELTGYANGQFGMDRRDAMEFHHRDWNTKKRA